MSGTAPVLLSVTAYSGEQFLTLQFNAVLDAANPPPITAFIHGTVIQHSVVLINGLEISVSTVEVDSTAQTVKVNFTGSTLNAGDMIDVQYADPSGSDDVLAIQGFFGGTDAASFTQAYMVPGARPAPADTTAPVFQSAATSTDGAKVILTYDEALDATHAAGAADFQVIVAGIARTVSSVAVNGSTVELTLASAITNGQAVAVGYNDRTPSDDPDIVQDAAGNDSASIVPAVSVTNNVAPPAVAPVLSSVTRYNGENFFTLHFDVALDSTNPPLASAFNANLGAPTPGYVAINGSPIAILAIDVNSADKTVKVTFAGSSLALGDQLNFEYTDPSGLNDPSAIQTLGGVDSPTFSQALTVDLARPADTTPPVFQSAATNSAGTKVILTYDEALSATTAGTGAYTVVVGGVARTVTGAVVNGSTVELTLSTAIANGDAVTVAYADPTGGNDANAVQDAAGNDAVSISPAASVTNSVPAPDTTPPVFQSAATNTSGNKIILTYDSVLDPAHAPGVLDFAVMVGGVVSTVAGVTINGSTVEITLADAITNGQAVTVAYTDPTINNDVNAVQDEAGNDAGTLPATSVTNSVPDTTAPAAPVITSTTPSSDSTPTLSGTAEANATVTVVIAGATYITTANGSGNWIVDTAEATPSSGTLAINANGSNSVSVTATDAANNTSTAATQTLVIDTTVPVFQSAATSADGTKVILTYDGALSATTAGTGTYTVMVGGVARTVTGAVVNGSTVELTLASAITNGETVTVAYADPTGGNDANAVQDAAGNDASSIGDPVASVTNSVPATDAPAPEPEPAPAPAPAPSPAPTDNDGVTAEKEDTTPGLPQTGGQAPVAGDGNGDGIQDSQQAGVTSTTFLQTTTSESKPAGAPSTFITLVADSLGGKADPDAGTASITGIVQKDAPAVLPEGMSAPLGLIGFTASIAQAGSQETFSLYVDAQLGVNGYWKKDASGTWINLASEAYGGKMISEGGKLRLDFQIVDGGQFDSDGLANGAISDPGIVGSMAQSITEHHPKVPTLDHFWF